MEEKPEFILEIGTEELPSSFVALGNRLLRKNFEEFLNSNRIDFDSIHVIATPRRLGLCVKNISLRQKDTVIEQIGPSKKIAFDKDGNPTKSAIGFAKSQNVDVKDLQIVSTPRGEYICVKKTLKGKKTKEILEEKLEDFFKTIVFPKNMRWGNEKITFGRPIKWIVALLNGEILNFSYGSYKAQNYSTGHRFLSPEKFEVKNWENFIEELENRWVIPDFVKRKEFLWQKIQELSENNNFVVEKDEDLLEEVTNLIEYPFPLCGEFEEKFLELPEEVIITTMKVHQKYFPVKDKNGRLLPKFITVSNMKAKDAKVVVRGNERVLKARLNDAVFFYEEDKKYPLSHYVEKLRKVVFHNKLGTSYEKMLRFKELATYLARNLNPDVEKITERSAYLCKADLETNMVYEFPELQGIMGKYYAIASKEPYQVAQAIYEHYLPRFSGDKLPETDAGAFIGIADRIDTITGFFIIREKPTGTGDPYALRRHALAITNIILEKGYRLSLSELISRSISLYLSKFEKIDEKVKDEIIDFFKQRFRNLMMEKYDFDVVDAVIVVDFDDIFRSYRKIDALSTMKKDEEFVNLIIPFKRIANITKDWDETVVVEKNFIQKEEINLFNIYKEISEKFNNFIENEDFIKALKELTYLKKPIDDFFDNVLVLEKDETLRKNRLSLLKLIYRTFLKIGDLKLLN